MKILKKKLYGIIYIWKFRENKVILNSGMHQDHFSFFLESQFFK